MDRNSENRIAVASDSCTGCHEPLEYMQRVAVMAIKCDCGEVVYLPWHHCCAVRATPYELASLVVCESALVDA